MTSRITPEKKKKKNKRLLLPPLATESGPSNLCYNPFGSRGDGTFGRHHTHAGKKKSLLSTVGMKRGNTHGNPKRRKGVFENDWKE